jgi:flagellar basal body-associated protein FliL
VIHLNFDDYHLLKEVEETMCSFLNIIHEEVLDYISAEQLKNGGTENISDELREKLNKLFHHAKVKFTTKCLGPLWMRIPQGY